MGKAENALLCFKDGFSCSQALLSAYCEDFGMSREEALKVSCAFGAGMGRMAETCGAVTGAFMVLSLKYGRFKADDEAAREKTYAMVNEFVRRFKARNGTIVCKELLGADMSIPEGMKYAKEHKLSAKRCPRFVKDAAEIVEEMLKE